MSNEVRVIRTGTGSVGMKWSLKVVESTEETWDTTNGIVKVFNLKNKSL